jgi:surfeit locus 1 family protein
MTVSRGTLAFAVLAVAVSLGCIRLGIWQLERLDERRSRNAQVLGRLGEAPFSIESLRRDSIVRFRRVSATGQYDFSNEFVLTTRSRLGAPGVHILTPMHTGAGDTAILVNRGWAYAPDGMTVDLSLFREDANAVVDGYVEEYAPAQGAVSTSSVARAVRRLDYDSISARLPYPLAAMLLVQRRDSGEFVAVDRGTPVRAEPPPLGEGSHRAYAVQWFAFAFVGIFGAAVVLRRDRLRRGTNQASGGTLQGERVKG